MLSRLFVPRLTGILLSGRFILLHFKIRLLLTRRCRKFPGNFTLNPNKKKLKYCIVGKISVEENAISAERRLKDDFVEHFAAPNIELTTSDFDG